MSDRHGNESNPQIRAATTDDAAEIARIYNHYIRESHATFETDPVPDEDIAARIRDSGELSLPWLVAEDGDTIAGYAYASKWKGRCAYRYSVESTVYLDPAMTGRGLGLPLYRALLDAISAGGSMHAVIAGISLPNEPSIRLHEKLGFEKVGVFPEVGYKFDRWIDVGYWQGML